MTYQLKYLISLVLIGIGLNQLWAQDSLRFGLDYPEFQLLRANEDYSFLADIRSQKDFWHSLKYIKLGDKSFVSLGGDFRAEAQRLNNEDWNAANNDLPLYLRLMLHSDWHFSPQFRLFMQFRSGHAIGRNGPAIGLNVDRLDFHQLFLTLNLGNSRFEIGRRELSYGSHRLISVREGTNVRQSFDGLRWVLQNQKIRLDLLAYAYNPQNTGWFDNDINTDQLLWGSYLVWNLKEENQLNFDIYYLGVDNQQSRFEAGTGPETRHSFGLRHWGHWNKLSYNNEAVYQLGEFASLQVQAWTISTDLSYQLPGHWSPTPGLKAEIISGDQNVLDDKLQTFNPLYPRGGYFGLLAVIGPANLMDIHPSLRLKPAKSWMLNFDWDFFWRHQLADGIYFPSGRLNIPGSSSNERFIGHQAGMQISKVVSSFLELELSYFHFFPGPFLEDVSEGADFSQLGTSLNFKF